MSKAEQGQPDARTMALWLTHAFENGHFAAPIPDSKLWVIGIDHLLQCGSLDIARFAVHALAARNPESRYGGTVQVALDHVPPPPADQLLEPFVDAPDKDVQIVRCAGACATLFAFAGVNHRLGVQINVIHRWFARTGVHVVYLRDFSRRAYCHGIASLAPDYGDTLTALLGIARELGSSRLLCYGLSHGGYAALRYGAEFGADRVLALSPQTNLPPEFLSQSRVAQQPQLTSTFGQTVDLRELWSRMKVLPRTHLVYAALNRADQAQAANLADFRQVSIEALPDVEEHNVMAPLMASGRLIELLDWLTNSEERPLP